MDTKYVGYAALIVAGSVVALWAGLPAFFLLLLLACPLIMFLMMRGGGHGGMHGRPDPSDGARRDTTGSSTGRDENQEHGHH